jgi:hypothetical protein
MSELNIALIGTVDSFTDPNEAYVVLRFGLPKREGGNGTFWTCSCPDYSHRQAACTDGRRAYPCKHLRYLWRRAAIIRKHTGMYYSKYVTLSPAGEEILGIRYSVRARKHAA